MADQPTPFSERYERIKQVNEAVGKLRPRRRLEDAELPSLPGRCRLVPAVAREAEDWVYRNMDPDPFVRVCRVLGLDPEDIDNIVIDRSHVRYQGRAAFSPKTTVSLGDLRG